MGAPEPVQISRQTLESWWLGHESSEPVRQQPQTGQSPEATHHPPWPYPQPGFGLTFHLRPGTGPATLPSPCLHVSSNTAHGTQAGSKPVLDTGIHPGQRALSPGWVHGPDESC